MRMQHPFAEHVGLELVEQAPGHSVCRIQVRPDHFNPQEVVHGAIIFAMADTGMGAALYPMLEDGEMCATVEIKISYFKYVVDGSVDCTSTVVNKGKAICSLEADIRQGDTLVAKASGTFSIFRRKERAR